LQRSRRCRVVKRIGARKCTPTRADYVSAVIVRIGKAAVVKVNETTKRDPETGETRQVIKYASAHDLRRSFGERWAHRVFPQEPQDLMRHQDIQTTQRYYVGRNAELTADAIWTAFDRVARQAQPPVAKMTARSLGKMGNRSGEKEKANENLSLRQYLL